MLKIATWNVNSLNVRLSQVLEWLEKNQPDVLALQEIKMQNTQFPFAAIEAMGYHAVVSGQKAYNGVAILSRTEGIDKVDNLAHFTDPQRRILGITWQGIRIFNVYVPNGSEVGCDKYQYKLTWLQHLLQMMQSELNQHDKLIILGDFNIAPADEDVYDATKFTDSILVSVAERKALEQLFNLGLQDTFQLFLPQKNRFSWWDYRAAAFKRNLGARIDLILASKLLAIQCISCEIDTTPRSLPRPSDHAPVMATFSL